MTRACALETNKLEKKAGRCFSSCSPLPSSSTQSVQSCGIATTKRCKIFLTSRLFIWRYCGVNILTILRFYISASSTSGEWWKLGRMEANSSCLILRTFACVGYKESEEHIFISRKPFPLQNHRSLKEMLASCRRPVAGPMGQRHLQELSDRKRFLTHLKYEY